MIRTPRYPQGTRARIRRGAFPIDPDLLGRKGTVVDIHERRPERVGVILDGEEEIREFAEDELEAVETAGEPDEQAETGPTVGP